MAHLLSSEQGAASWLELVTFHLSIHDGFQICRWELPVFCQEEYDVIVKIEAIPSAVKFFITILNDGAEVEFELPLWAVGREESRLLTHEAVGWPADEWWN